MSRENVEVVRQPVAVRADSHRTLDQAFYLRFRRLTVALLRGGWRVLSRLHPGSWLRRAVMRLYVRRAFEALNRGDLELFFIFVHPEIESFMAPELVTVGSFEPIYRGVQARFEAQEHWVEEWGEFRFEPEEAIDFGDDRFLVLGRIKGSGRGSGITVDSEWGLLVTYSDGLAIREQSFLDHAEALEAVGL